MAERGAVDHKTFTVLHTNDMHSNLIGVSPSADYNPTVLDADDTRGGFARLATLIALRRQACQEIGPVLLLDAGDYSMQTAFGAGIRETGGAELQLMYEMGYDATTFGNHEFDLGPDGLGVSIGKAYVAGRCPPVVASNTDLGADDPTLDQLRALAAEGPLHRHLVIERGGLRFGILGVIGKEATFYTGGKGAVSFADAIETAKTVAKHLRETEHVDVVIALSHGGVVRNEDGTYTSGDDVTLAEQVPGIDVVIGGHGHTRLNEPIIVNGRTPVVQSGRYTRNLGELHISIDKAGISVDSYALNRVDASILGDQHIIEEIDGYKQIVTDAVFASRGYAIDQPLVIIPQDMPNTLTDVAAMSPLANFATDAVRAATGADVALSASGMIREGLMKGRSGVQTVYDVFSIAPLGQGVVDDTAGSAIVTAYFTGQELKHLLEFLLVDNPAHPGEYFPRTSGMRFCYDLTRPRFDVVTAIELGDLEKGYTAIDITPKNEELYSLSCPLYLGAILVTIPTATKGALTLAAKNREGQTLTNRVEALDLPRASTPDFLPPRHTMDRTSVATSERDGVITEIKEWQAVMDSLRRLPVEHKGDLPAFPTDERATEVRGIKEG
jgi:5'-nucleotidase/UDP-sugar diphosphatase